VARRADFVLAYHPPIFKPISSLRADGVGTESVVYQCIRRGIAIYATHTALDAAEGGTNDVLASLCGVRDPQPLLNVEPGKDSRFKLVVFVPANGVDKVAQAMFAAGAGHIGDYTHCSFRSAGQGTFLGGEAAKPAVGQRGRLEFVDELRLETLVPAPVLSAVVVAMLKAHPYEEPAFDVYPLASPPTSGLGRCGRLSRPLLLRDLARKLKRATHAESTRIVGDADSTVDRAVVVAGAADDIPFRTALGDTDVIVTGEIRHHDALKIARIGCSAIELGHWASERPVLEPLAARLRSALPKVTFRVSQSDRDPFAAS
jgi:dinuclear metal center YbgI/SA1388 family protein